MKRFWKVLPWFCLIFVIIGEIHVYFRQMDLKEIERKIRYDNTFYIKGDTCTVIEGEFMIVKINRKK